MKPYLCLVCLMVACQPKPRFQREAAAFPVGYVGQWEAILPGRGPQVFQAGISVVTSGDSLLWQYFSQLVDTTTNVVIPCGAQMDFMPIWWDDSLQVGQANHGYGFDFIRPSKPNQLQLNSLWLATKCRGPDGFNATQLLLSKVTSFRYQP